MELRYRKSINLGGGFRVSLRAKADRLNELLNGKEN